MLEETVIPAGVMEEKPKPTEEEVKEMEASLALVQDKIKAENKKAMNVYMASMIFKGGGRPQGPSKIGVTRKNKKLSKSREKIAKNSRKVNRGK